MECEISFVCPAGGVCITAEGETQFQEASPNHPFKQGILENLGVYGGSNTSVTRSYPSS